MRRWWGHLHRFCVWLGLSLCLTAGVCGSIHAAAPAGEQPVPAQALPSPPVPTETRSAQSPTPRQTPKEGYTLSQDRYEKAVTYSRASYELYFVSVALSIFALVLLLKFG
ncbi:MAG: hypothetical protein ACRD51_12135, partial [Candidatus Acidiferrum sp.]